MTTSAGDFGSAPHSTRSLGSPLTWIRDLWRNPLIRSGYSLVINVGTTSALGLVYWVSAARLYSAEQVGINSAILSVMTTIGAIAQLNFASILTRFLPAASRRAAVSLMLTAYGIGALAALLGAGVFVLGVDLWLPSLDILSTERWLGLWFVLSTVVWTIVALGEGALAGLHRATLIPVANTAFAVAKIVLLIVFFWSPLRDVGIYTAWTVPAFVTVILVNLLTFGRFVGRHQPGTDGGTMNRRDVASYFGGDFLGQFFLLVMIGASPLLILHNLGAEANAGYYLTETIAYSLYLVSKAMTTALVAEGAGDPRGLPALARRALAHAVMIVGLGTVAVVAAAPVILGIYGGSYAADDTLLLQLLALSAVPFTLTSILLGVARVQKRVASVAITQGIMMVLILAASVPLMNAFGVVGMGIAWAAGQTIVALGLAAFSLHRLELPSLAAMARSPVAHGGAIVSAAAAVMARHAFGLLGLFAALAIWALCLTPVDPANLTDLGLASAMQPAAWIPFLLLSVGLLGLLRDEASPRWLPHLYLVALALVLHATPALEYGTLRYPWAWPHLGIVDYIQRNGSGLEVSGALRIYRYWPGFFGAAAFFSDLTGVHDLAAVARWWPLIQALLYLAIVPAIYRRFTSDRRLVLFGTWIFIAGNWIGQDYFSPQSLAFFFYMVLVAVCVRYLIVPAESSASPLTKAYDWFAARLSRGTPPARAAAALVTMDETTRRTAAIVAVLLILGITFSHPLTPLLVILLLGVLMAFGLMRPYLFLFAGVVHAIVVLYVGAPYTAGNLGFELHNLGVAAHVNLINTAMVSTGQAVVSWVSRSLTLSIGITAVLGFLLRARAGHRDLVPALLAAAPMPLVVATSYGGEVIFRAYLFALPGLAFFAAAVFFTSPGFAGGVLRRGIATVFAAAIAIAFVFANDGKDRRYAFSPAEIAASRWLSTNAPDPSLLIQGATVYPTGFKNYEYFDYVTLSDEPADSVASVLGDPARVLASWLSNRHYKAGYVVITRTQKAYLEALNVMPSGALDDIEQALLKSTLFSLVRADAGVMIFKLNPSARTLGEWVN